MIHTVDAHVEGEATRVVVGGVIDIPGETMLEKMRWMQSEGDWLRQLLLFEPRGHAALCADIVVKAVDPEAAAGYIIMESNTYEGMSGSNTLCTAAVLLETGAVPIEEPLTRFKLEPPAGTIEIEARCEGGRCRSVRFTNVPAFVSRLDEKVSVPGYGDVVVDIAYGGAFMAFADGAQVGLDVVREDAARLAEFGERLREAVAAQVEVVHPIHAELSYLSFGVVTSPPRVGGDARNATVVSPGRVDRCPTGTATSARLAIEHARGRVGIGQDWINESVIDSRFVGRIESTAMVGEIAAVVPSVEGRVWITGTHQFSIDPDDPFSPYRLGDTWGVGKDELRGAEA